MNENTNFVGKVGMVLRDKFVLFPILAAASYLSNTSNAQTYVSLDIISTLNYIQTLLMHIGPLISAILFVLAGIFYAVGQLFPAYQRATFHTTAIDFIVGAIIVATLSVTSSGFALASTHLLTNITNST
jgi:hypothetical protein